MSGKVLLLLLAAAALQAGQESSSETTPKEMRVIVMRREARQCAIPLITIKPKQTPHMPRVNPSMKGVSPRFFIVPPAPPCEEPDRYPVLPTDAPAKQAPSQTQP